MFRTYHETELTMAEFMRMYKFLMIITSFEVLYRRYLGFIKTNHNGITWCIYIHQFEL